MAVEKLEIETYFGKCKCCLNYGYLRTMWENHVVEERSEIYGQMLTECFSIEWTTQISEEDDQICEDCIWKLREACTFKKQVLQCQTELKSTQIDVDLEIKSEPDNSYDVEYLDEEFLEDDNNNENSDEDSGDERESEEEKPSPDDESSSTVFKEDNDDDYDENQNPEDNDDEEFTPDSPAPRKRRSRRSTNNDADSDPDAPRPKWPKKLPKQERWKTYRQYSDKAMTDAVKAVVSKSMNQKEAAKLYKVPRKSLSAKIICYKNAERTERKQTEKDDTPSELQDNEDSMIIIKKHRENVHSVLAYSNATPIRGFWGVGYVCAFCPEQFPQPSSLKKHTQGHANFPSLYTVPHVRTHVTRLDVTGLKCRLCKIKMEDLLSLRYHLQKKHKKPMHFDINNHMIPFKFDTVDLQCIECEKKFKNFKLLSEHMANIHYRNYVCGKCDRGFVNRVNLVAHKDTHKTGTFNCEYCDKQFDTRRKKTTHERNYHTLQVKYEKCGYCKMSFQNAAQKNNHEMRTHQKQMLSFDCASCDKSYARQRSLRDHIKREHLLERPYKCTVEGCNKSFYLNRTLQAHILTHSDGRPFPCDLCPKSYRSQKSLKGHMYIHTDKKEFKCTKCYKSYVLEDNLVRHMDEKHRSED